MYRPKGQPVHQCGGGAPTIWDKGRAGDFENFFKAAAIELLQSLRSLFLLQKRQSVFVM